MASQTGRLPSLDGIRAVAIATVILCHLQQRFALSRLPLPPVDGVELFFVLSGFLITTLLLREREKTGRIDLASFFKRRALRILPALLIYLVLVVVFCHVVHRPAPWSSVLSSAFFLGDFYDHSFFTEHLWSLAIEEQFYLVWPLLLMWALHRGGKRFAAWVILLLIAASPLYRVGVSALHPRLLDHSQGTIIFGRMDSLFAGCLVAVWTGTQHMERFFERTQRLWWLSLVYFFVLSPVLRIVVGNAYIFTIGYTCESLAMAYFIVWAIRHSTHPVGRFLNLKPMMYVGVLSYSLYLYQSAPIHGWDQLPWKLSLAPALAAVAVLSLASYYLVEKPFLRYKVRKVKDPAFEPTPVN